MNLKYIILVLMHQRMRLRSVSSNQQNTSREIAPTITEELEVLQQDKAATEVSDTDTSPIATNTQEHLLTIDIPESNIHNEQDLTVTTDVMAPIQKETTCAQSIPTPQVQHAAFFPCFHIGVSEHNGSRRRPKSQFRKPRDLLAANVNPEFDTKTAP